jgi:hypothetical protein
LRVDAFESALIALDKNGVGRAGIAVRAVHNGNDFVAVLQQGGQGDGTGAPLAVGRSLRVSGQRGRGAYERDGSGGYGECGTSSRNLLEVAIGKAKIKKPLNLEGQRLFATGEESMQGG